jgi:hypothetical protein
MITISEAVFESTESSELAASVGLFLRPSRFSELDDESLQGGIGNDQF